MCNVANHIRPHALVHARTSQSSQGAARYAGSVIVVSGTVEPAGRREGIVVAIAGSAVAMGATVQVIGIVPDGEDGDHRLIDLATRGIGHAAVLRTRLRPLEPADVELALRYLPDIRVIVAVDGESGLDGAIAEGAAYSGATLVLVVGDAQRGERVDLPESAIVLEAPADDPDGTFAGFVGAFAARLDGGAVPADAWAATIRDLAVDPVTAAPGPRGRASAG